MKKQFLLASALGLALQASAISRAVAVEPKNDSEHVDGHRHHGPGGGLEKMTEERLKLTADQKKTFESVAKDRSAKMKALQDEFMGKRKAIMDASDSKIEAMLTADQKAEFAKMKEEFAKKREEFKEHRRDHDEHDRSEPTDQK